MTLAEYVQMHPTAYAEPYEPRTLPPVPRTQCPHSVVVERRGGKNTIYFVSVPCRGIVHDDSGWCDDHLIAQRFLECGARICFPQVALGRTVPGSDHARLCGAGCAEWEAYAASTSVRHLAEDIEQVKVLFPL